MGTSNWQNISYNIDLIRKINPYSILDIGVGFGRWGMLFREFLEIWDNGNYKGDWRRSIEGVEIFPDYIKDYHKYFYTKIYYRDAYEFLEETHTKWNLINCGDVIEHFEKEKGINLINLILKKSDYVLINIPIGKNWKQELINNNEYEIHKSFWKIHDFRRFKYQNIRTFRDINLRKFAVILLSDRPFHFKKDFNKRYGKYFTFKNVLFNIFHLNFLKKFLKK
jgi:hypothetical protein